MRGQVLVPSRGGPRLLRTLVLGGSGIAVGSLAHTNADGTVHLSLLSIPLLLSVVALAWVATARRVPVAVTAGILGSGQVLTHLALSAGHIPRVLPHRLDGPAAAVAQSHHSHHGLQLDLRGGGPSSLDPALESAAPFFTGGLSLTVDGWMVAAHLLATAALTLLFTVGERALWRTIERFLPQWTLPVLPAPVRSPVPAVIGPAARGLAHRSVRDRAPPV